MIVSSKAKEIISTVRAIADEKQASIQVRQNLESKEESIVISVTSEANADQSENKIPMDLFDIEMGFARVGALCKMILDYSLCCNCKTDQDAIVFAMDSIIDFAEKAEKAAQEMQGNYEIVAVGKGSKQAS